MATFTFRFPDGAPTVLHVHLNQGADTDAVLTAIEALANFTEQLGDQMALDISNLTREVQETKTAQAAVKVILQNQSAALRDLAERLEAGSVDPAEIQRMADELDASTNDLVAAANPEPEPTPEPAPESTPEPTPEPAPVDPDQPTDGNARRR